MNTPFVRWLFDVDAIPTDAGQLHMAWEHPLPGWLWALIAALGAWLAIWSYARLSGARLGRGGLAVVRTLILMLAIVVLAGPAIELRRESVEQDWVLVLADRSASMAIADATDPRSSGQRRTRDTQLEELMRETQPFWEELAEERQVHWLGFHSGAFSLEVTEGAANLSTADGEHTNIRTAIEQALQRAAARPVSGIVLLTDGRSSDPPDRALLRRLQSDAIGVNVVPLGSAEPLGDLALRRVDAPRRAFVRDKVPIVVEVDRFGSEVRDLGGKVRLVDELTGETLDEVELTPGDDRSAITLTAEPELTGEATWSVELVTERPDLIPDNNRKPFLIELVDRPLRVLFVEGYPRWEYRYLKNLLVREKSIDSSVMLISADRDFAQEGNAPITRLPRSPEEFARYDVVVIGDVPAGFFSPDQLEMIRNHVAERGAGLLWIGGERSTPSTFTGTVLADLLPMRGSLTLPRIDGPVNIEPTELADRLGVLRVVSDATVGWPDELRNPDYGWSKLWYAQRIEPGRLKPTAEVLAQTTTEIDGSPLPLVIHLRYGAGQSIYVATDEVWRWRYGRGEYYPDQFWIQMIRMLGRESLSTAGERAVLDVHPRRVEVGRPVQVSLRMLDAQLVDPRRTNVVVTVTDARGERVTELELRRDDDAESQFRATWLPDVTGALDVRVDDPVLRAERVDLMAPLEVFSRDDELRRPETDHDLLARLAAETGGRMLEPTAASIASLELPNRSIKTENPLRERIWDTPFVLILAITLLTLEWIGRKVLRLV